jgi:DME family drug/metabolite transporter
MLGELAALGAALSWTVSALFYRKALQQAKPVSANIVRLACTGGLLLLLVVAFGKLDSLTSLPSSLAVLSVVSGLVGLGVGDTLYMVSLKTAGVARAVPVTCTYPLFSLLWTAVLEGEEITASVVLGAMAIVFGVLLLSRSEHASTTDIGQQRPLYVGIAFALATAILWSISIAMINVAVTQAPDLDHALAINTLRTASVAAALLATAPLLDRGLNFARLNKKTMISLVIGGLVALGLGWFFLAYSFIETTESRAVPISSTTPLFSTLAGILLFHEKMTTKGVLGSAIIVLGIFIIFLVR